MAITKDVMMGKTLRKSFAKQEQILETPEYAQDSEGFL